jgi:hypothetical protein
MNLIILFFRLNIIYDLAVSKAWITLGTVFVRTGNILIKCAKFCNTRAAKLMEDYK